MSQFVLITNQYFVLNYFQWRYLLMFVKFTFCIKKIKFYYFFKLKIWPWTYVREECLVNFKTISGDETLIIWIKLDSSDTPQILLEQIFFLEFVVVHVSEFCSVDCSCCAPARAATYTSKFFTVLGYAFSCFLGMFLFRICKFMIITFVQDAISL